MSEDLNKLREPYIVARVNWQEDNGDDHQRAVTLGDDLAVTSHHYANALERRLQAAEERAEKLERALKRARPYAADLPIVGDADLALIDAALKTEGA